jgi:hypothetical protein
VRQKYGWMAILKGSMLPNTLPNNKTHVERLSKSSIIQNQNSGKNFLFFKEPKSHLAT